MNLLRPLITFIFGPLSPEIANLLSFLLIIVLVILIGYLSIFISRSRIFKRISLIFSNRTNSFQNKPAALVKLAPKVYVLGIIVEDQIIKKENNQEIYFRVFVPSSPVPVTGWTLIVDPSKIQLLNCSYKDVFSITSSGGLLGIKTIEIAKKDKKTLSTSYPQKGLKNT
ncbi:MAG: hypothetical protein ACPLXL_01710 [Minisyncoccia bacterium]